MIAGNMPAVADYRLVEEIRNRQNDAVEDDYRIGMIEDYLEGRDMVCILELWKNALGESIKPSKRDSNDISLIMQAQPGWEKSKNPRRFPDFGRQTAWIRSKSTEDEDDFLPF